MKDAIFGSFAAWVKADNFEGKRRFIQEYSGASWLSRLFADAAVCEEFPMRLRKKVILVLHDFVLNDESIFEENPFLLRSYFCGDENVLNMLKVLFEDADLARMDQALYRQYALRILFRLHQYRPASVGPLFLPVLAAHKSTLQGQISSTDDESLKETLQEEL